MGELCSSQKAIILTYKIVEFRSLVGYNILGDDMLLLQKIVNDEKVRIEKMMSAYEEELQNLPKGYISTKHINNNEYYYLQFREGKKVTSKYLGKDEGSIADVRLQLERRAQICEVLTALREEYALANKYEEMI